MLRGHPPHRFSVCLAHVMRTLSIVVVVAWAPFAVRVAMLCGRQAVPVGRCVAACGVCGRSVRVALVQGFSRTSSSWSLALLLRVRVWILLRGRCRLLPGPAWGRFGVRWTFVPFLRGPG